MLAERLKAERERLERAHEAAADTLREVATDDVVMQAIKEVDEELHAQILAASAEWREASEALLSAVAQGPVAEAADPKQIRVEVSNAGASGRRTGWHKHVTSVDTSQRGGYAFEGEFLNEGLHDLPEGSVVLEVRPEGSVKNHYQSGWLWKIVDAEELEKRWELVAKVGDWKRESLVLRDAAKELLS